MGRKGKWQHYGFTTQKGNALLIRKSGKKHANGKPKYEKKWVGMKRSLKMRGFK